MSTVHADACESWGRACVTEGACVCSLPARTSALVCILSYPSYSVALFLWRERTLILSPPRHVLWNMLAAFVVPPACSAFLALSYNGGLEHCDVIKPFQTTTAWIPPQERRASQCRVHGTRFIVGGWQRETSVTSKQRWWKLLSWFYCFPFKAALF